MAVLQAFQHHLAGNNFKRLVFGKCIILKMTVYVTNGGRSIFITFNKTIDLTIDLVNGTNINGNRIDIDNSYSYFNKRIWHIDRKDEIYEEYTNW